MNEECRYFKDVFDIYDVIINKEGGCYGGNDEFFFILYV